MSEKDTVSSQDIPALIRALGTLALAAATAVVIKWFISHDTKEKDAGSDEADLQNNHCSTELDGEKPYDGDPIRNTNQSGTSDEGGKKLHLLLECCPDTGYNRDPGKTSCISSSAIIENAKEINLSSGISHKANQVTSDAYRLNKAATSPENSTLVLPREDSCHALLLTPETRGSATDATEDPIVSSSLTHMPDTLSCESSARIQELEWNFGTRLSYGKCIDELNTRSLGSQHQQSVQSNAISNAFVHHSTISIGVSGGTVINVPNDKDRVLNCYSENHFIRQTTYPDEQEYSIDNMVSGYNDKGFTLGIIDRHKFQAIRNPYASEVKNITTKDACIPSCHNDPVISDINEQVTVNSLVEIDTSDCAETLCTEHETAASAGDVCKMIKQNVTLHNRMDSQVSNIYLTELGHKFTLNTLPESPKQELKHSIEDVVHNIHDGDNDNVAPSLKTVLPKKESDNFPQLITSMDAHTGRCELQESLQGSYFYPLHPNEEKMTDITYCYTNNTKEIAISENRRATCDYSELSALVYPLGPDDPDSPINNQVKQNEHQLYAEEVPVVLNNIEISKDLSQIPLFDKPHEDIDVHNENVGLYCKTSNAANEMMTFENITNDPTMLDTVSLMVVAELISDVKAIDNEKDNTNFQKLHTCRMENHEGCNFITNDYLDNNHEVAVTNNCSKIIKSQEDCIKDTMLVTPEPSLESTAFPTADSSLEAPLPCFLATYNTVQTSQPHSNEENVFQLCVSIGRDEECSREDETISPSKADQHNDPVHCDSNLGPTQDQNMCLTGNNDMHLVSKEKEDVSHSREKIMSAIAENTELILPEYQSKYRFLKKVPLITKSCDNILSGHSYKEPTLKTKAQSMLCLLTEYYSSKLPSENSPVEEVARGSFIRIPKGLQSIGEAMRFQLTLGNCLELLKLARKNRVPDLLKAVYTVISDNYLNVLKNSAVYGQLTGLEREKILHLRMRGQFSLCVVETKSIFGMNKYVKCQVETPECRAQLYCLDMETNQWNPVTCIPEEASLKGCSICSMHNYLFIAGGLQETTEGLTCSNKLFCYNPLTDIWTQLSPMNEGRSQLKLVPLDGYLYAIGGECLHTVEKYDPRSNKWTFVAPLPKGTFAVAHEAAACGGEIYISGGHLFYRLLKYSPVRDQWEECPFNASKGRSCDMVAVGSILYRFDMHKDSAVNILKYNTMAKLWSEYQATFSGSKIPFRCALLEGNIYCLNRETTAKFTLEEEKAVFETDVFSTVPTRGVGFPHPTVLCLRGSVSQTSV